MLLLNLGGPETLDDVQPFLYNLFADPDIIRLPKAAQFLQPFIATVISSLRAPKSAEGCVSDWWPFRPRWHAAPCCHNAGHSYGRLLTCA